MHSDQAAGQTLTLEQYQKEKSYWLSKLQGFPVNSRFPADFSRHSSSKDTAEMVERFPVELSDQISALSKNSPFAAYMILLSGVHYLLALHTNNEDTMVGMPAFKQHIDNPDRTDNAPLFALRVQIDPAGSMKDLLALVKQTVLEADHHPNVPFRETLSLLDYSESEKAASLYTLVLLEEIHASLPQEEEQADLVFLFSKNEHGLELRLRYRAELFLQSTISILAGQFMQFLAVSLSHPTHSLAQLDISTDKEKRMLRQFNETDFGSSNTITITEWFEDQVTRTPDHPAIVDEGHVVSYLALNERSNRLARELRIRGVGAESHVAVLADRSAEMIVAILAVLKAGGAYVPIDPEFPEERKRFMLEDSEVRIILKSMTAEAPSAFEGSVLVIEDAAWEQHDSTNMQALAKADNLAYIMYTSGTTGRPKGVMVEHRNVIRLVDNTAYVPFAEIGRMAQTGAVSFDASTFEIFGTLLYGGTIYPVRKDVLLNIKRLELFLIESGITTMWLTTPLFHRLAQENPAMFARLRHLVVGGELLSPQLVQSVKQVCTELVLWNCYGPTENTTFSTCYRVQGGEELVPIGGPISHSTAYILNPEGRLQPVGVPGELWVGGAGVARGYLNTPELTAEKFVSNPFRPGERMYRTGDRARWRADGTMEFLGRMDRQLKIRGYRIEPSEIESVLLQVAGVKEAAVTTLENTEFERELCAYVIADEELDLEQLRARLALLLPGPMLPAHLMQLAVMPLTSNGKMDRKALPIPSRSNQTTYVEPRDELEIRLVHLWQDILQVEPIGIRDHFFERGGHSLKATTLLSQIHKQFHVELSLKQIFAEPTIEQLAAAIKRAAPNVYMAIPRVPEQTYYPLSSSQKRMFILDQIENTGISYNIPIVMTMEGELDRERFSSAFQLLVDRHEALRTSFHIVEGQPMQRIHNQVDFEVAYQEAADKDKELLLEKFNRNFDITKPCVPQVALVKTAANRHLFFFNIHHIVADGTSMGILVKQFMLIYQGSEFPELSVQYKDFAAWQNERLASSEMARIEKYWLSKVEQDWPVLHLPTDFSRPAVKSFEGDRLVFELPLELAQKVRDLALAANTTVYMVLLAAFCKLLAKYSGQEDVVVGTGIAGRQHADLDQMVGMFVNMLLLRNQPSGHKTFLEFLAEVRETSLQAFEYQEYPFEEIVERSHIERDPSRNPLFDIAFVVQNIDLPDLEIPGLTCLPEAYGNFTSKFDMTMFVWEQGEAISFHLEYCTALYTAETIQQFANHYINAVRAAVLHPGRRLSESGILTEAEASVLLEAGMTNANNELDTTAQRLFEEQVDRTPNRIAVVSGEEQLTYKQLDERANQVAASLLGLHQVKPDKLIGILMEGSALYTEAVLGILKAGAAFVPLDPELPYERLRMIADDAQIEVILTAKKHIKLVNHLQWECSALSCFICLDSEDVFAEEEAEKNDLMNEQLWEYVGTSANDDIEGGGWNNSYTGEPFTKQEMDEYGDNILLKLLPHLTPETRVLEIGCATGISMYRIAPHVGLYYGTDLSRVIIRKNEQKVQEEGWGNIKLQCLPAHQIDQVSERDFDIVILNSVIQVFHGHNYLRQVIDKAVDLLGEKGMLFLGDIMDLDKKEELRQSLILNKEKFPEAKTKTNVSSELFLSKRFLEDLTADVPAIQSVVFSDKIHTIENELVRFRYDAVINIDKTGAQKENWSKNKSQYGRSHVVRYSTTRLDVETHSRNLAYTIYTSGTTGTPKGTLIEHRGLANLKAFSIEDLGVTADDRIGQFASISFDASIFELFSALLTGACLVMIPKEAVQNYSYFERFVSEQKISVMLLPPTYLVHVDPEKMRTLRTMITGGSATSPELVAKWKDHVEYWNAYGPTEATIIATVWKADSFSESMSSVPIGKPLRNMQIYIIDPYGQLQPAGAVGELCIGGEGLARGYLNRPEITASQFVDNAFKPGEKMYKTGDLAKWLPNGTIAYLGRQDHQVKIRGYRIEIGEIESALLRHDRIDEAVVIVKQDPDGGNSLYAYYSGIEAPDISEVRLHLSSIVPAYMIPSSFVSMKQLPLTSSGKVDRKFLNKMSLKPLEEQNYEAARNGTEELLVQVWQEVLGEGSISIHSHFFQLGGDSIKAIQISTRMLKHGYKLEMKLLFQYPTIAELSPHVKNEVLRISQEAVEGEVPLTPIQHWFFEECLVEPHHFNQSVMLFSRERLDERYVCEAWERLSHHHDVLRMVFRWEEGSIVQWNRGVEASSASFRMDVIDLREADSEEELAERMEEAANRLQAGLSLAEGPLSQLALFRTKEGDHLLLIVHHLVVDGVSWRILAEDFGEAYRGLAAGASVLLPEKTTSFQAWAEELEQYACSRKLLKELPYWQQIEQADAEPLFVEGSAESCTVMEAETVSVMLSEADTQTIRKEAHRAYRTEMNDILLTALGLALQEWSGHKSAVITLEGHGREEIGADVNITRTVGWFTTMFPVVLEVPEGEPGYQLQSVKEMLRRVPNKGFGYGVLTHLTPAAYREGLSGEMKSDISFNYLGDFDEGTPNSDGIGISPRSAHSGEQISPSLRRSHLLMINGLTTQGRMQFTFSYPQEAYRRETMERLGSLFGGYLSALAQHCTRQTEIETTPSDLGCAELSLDELQAWRKELKMACPGAELERIYPLSPLQEGMLFHAQYDPQSLAYFEQLTMLMEGGLELSVFEQSFNELLARHEILRTVFRQGKGRRPLQGVLSARKVKVYAEDLRGFTASEQELRIKQYCVLDKAAGFDLTKDALMRFAVMRIGASSYKVIWSHHHIILDGWCLNILIGELTRMYHHNLHQVPLQLGAEKPYRAYIEWLEQQDQDASIGYWREYLADYNQRAILPVQREQVMAVGYELGVLEFTLDASLTAGLEEIARRNQTTLSTVLQAIWGLMLATYNHATDVVFGTIVSGRPAELDGVETMVGLFINAIPVRMQLDPSSAFSELLQQVQQRALETAAHDYVSLAAIQAQSELKGDLLHHLFVFENFPLHAGADDLAGDGEGAEAGFVIRDFELFEQTNYDFTLVVMPEAELKIKFSYNAQVYAPAAMEQIREHLLTLADHVTQTPEGKLSELSLLTAAEQREAALALSAMDVPYAENMVLDALVSEQVQRTPSAIAVIHGDQQMTYAELEDWSNRWSHHLAERGVQPGDRVGLSVQRGMLSVVGMLAILKAGAAYVPLDPEDPKERKLYVMRQAELAAVVTDAEADYGDEAIAVVRLDHSATVLRCANSRPEVQRSSRDLAYIIFTSGSTGVPKGVMIEHHAAVNLISWVNETYEVGELDRMLWITSLSFDLSVYDVLGVLAAGGCVVVAQKDAVRDPQELKRLLLAERITLWDSVPTTMSYLVQSIENDPEAAPWQQTDLRLALVSGDWIPVNLQARMSEVFSQAQLIGLGGATEATVWSNFYPIYGVSEGRRSIPYGKPLANNVFYILDPFGLPVPAGVRGELYIGGVGVARGYAGDREKTEQAFVPNPFRPGESMYRTGDLGRLLPDGNMEFLGRKDHQVKVRGFRVELGEIEYWLRQHADIEEAVVLCIDSGGREQLCAYIVVPTRDVEAAVVREHLAKHLPAYMLPSHVLPIPALPLTANGKIDRKALPAPESMHREAVREPQSDVEKKLAAIWQEVLGVQHISVEDDFFLLGGHSLLAATLVARIAAETGLELPLPFIFRYPTVGQLAERIEEMQVFRGEADTPVTLLQQGREGTIFCFPPVAGYGFEYKELAMQLPSHSWYAFDFVMEENRLAAYVKWITELQTEGPYVLLGYSAGGNLAYEVGKELEAQGHEVSGIVILDAMRRMEAEAKSQEEIEEETEAQLKAAESRYGEIVKVPSIRREAGLRMNAYRSYLYGLVNEGSVKAPLYVITSEEEKSREAMAAYSERQVAASWSGSSRAELVHYTGHGSHMNMLQAADLYHNARKIQLIFQSIERLTAVLNPR